MQTIEKITKEELQAIADNSVTKMQHKELANGRWAEMSFLNQMGNIGSEVSRTLNWKKKGNEERSNSAFERTLELMDLTIQNHKEYAVLRELCRMRDCFCESYLNNDIDDLEKINKYFFFFGLAYSMQNRNK